MLVNLTNKGVTGKEAETALDAAGIIVNKNAVPYDEKPPAVASGIRLGSPIVSTRGMREPEMREVVSLIACCSSDRIRRHWTPCAPRPRRYAADSRSFMPTTPLPLDQG